LKTKTELRNSGSLVFWSSFSRQPARVLIVEASPPGWSETCTVVCDALDNFLSLACNLDGPCRIPLLSLYAISRQQECLLPFQVRGNLARLHSCVEELRSIPGDGCIRGAARGGDLLRRAVLDSLQQFKQYMRYASTGSQACNNASVEVTVVTSQPGRGVVHQLETGLKDCDLVSLRRLLVVQILGAGDRSQDCQSSEDAQTEGTDANINKHLHEITAHTEPHEFTGLNLYQPSVKLLYIMRFSESNTIIIICLLPSVALLMSSDHKFKWLNSSPCCANGGCVCCRALRADGVCESVLYGLPLVIRPTTCWQLDWDEMETNGSLFQALCHTLRVHSWVLRSEIKTKCWEFIGCVCALIRSVCVCVVGVFSHFVLQSSPSLSLLLKPVVSRELLLPCSLPASAQDPVPCALQTVQVCRLCKTQTKTRSMAALRPRSNGSKIKQTCKIFNLVYLV
uniref:Meiosis 1 associated protein n=1 Tax=Kryptolebias marmoratus TaxID=37003 RepID=A0A3Q2ZZD9_KRYMA